MKAIIFDLDGTLWDTTDVVVKLWNIVLQKRCPSLLMTNEIMSSFMGKNKAQFVDEFFAGIEKAEAESIITEIFASEQDYLRVHGARLYDDVIGTMKKLNDRYALCIVSNCQYGYLRAFCDYYDMDNILTDFECAGRTDLPKGENIKLVIERNGFESAIYVGDTKSDETAANDADVPFVYAAYGFGKVSGYSAKIDSFAEITSIAERLLK